MWDVIAELAGGLIVDVLKAVLAAVTMFGSSVIIGFGLSLGWKEGQKP